MRGAHHREVLEPEVALVTEVVGRGHLAADDDVLDPDAEPPVGVVAWLCAGMGGQSEVTAEDRDGGTVPLETVMPAFKAVLLYAVGKV